jgi:hypothetical protein
LSVEDATPTTAELLARKKLAQQAGMFPQRMDYIDLLEEKPLQEEK